ncbi:WhiB family transcription factor [Mycobacterium phage Jamie19]|uniref:WhiB family transcription factor n=12 Tax=Charlievirus TaxID=1623280 RepID=A0A142K7W5_9CAUD|nr:WhiB family transcriptional regulator [Mycobacterium phage Carcharodon]YP_009304950.1 WhiB family transcriptional regulator [Mycobacterium phage Panchino]YP_009616898.1 WhiB family transcriptional regulator [Mycobacterium phage Pipsqueaks]YP_010052181.1 WhiB family transcriptional regulator [Mycobacterium phage Fulbright]YP_010052320.1 WhiB family transcriptional regulator [Mycobacterium phage Tapioca]YP_010052386.1 WhiB family transcriptional regulator [Mycobacterium phage Jamie19]AMS0199
MSVIYGLGLVENWASYEPDDWTLGAACTQTDPEVFFPEKGEPVGPAREICKRCDVRQQCRDIAIAHDEEFGIWGGLTPNQRRALKRGVTERDCECCGGPFVPGRPEQRFCSRECVALDLSSRQAVAS